MVAIALAALASAVAPAAAVAHGGETGDHEHEAVLASAAATGARSVSVSGALQRIHGHRSGSRRESVAGWMLTTAGGRRIPLTLPAGIEPRAGGRVRVTGTQRGAALRVRTLRRIPGSATASAAALPNGAKKTAVVLFNFSDDRSQPFTVEQVRQALFTGPRSVSSFYAAESHGRLSLTGRDRADGDVHGWLEIDASSAECFGGSKWDWYTKADAAVAAAGGDLSGYDHVVYVHPRVASCGFAGIATLGGDWSSLNGTIGLWVAGHEIGHNYEFEHAGRLSCRDAAGQPVSVGGNCSVGEYDDPFDIMGNRFQRHSSGIRQLQARWIPSSNLRTVTADGTYDLAPLAEPQAAVQVLRIPRRDGRYYWLEFRRPYGAFDDFAASEPVVNGVTIRIAGGLEDPGVSQLVDTTPATGRTARDEPLAAGRTFTDAEQLVRITTDFADARGARVTVGLGPAAQGEIPVPAAGQPPVPAPVAGSDARAGGGEADPAPSRRYVPSRASANRRVLAAARLATADGRGLSVRGRRGRAALDLTFKLGAAASAPRTSQLELRLRAPRRCRADVSVRRSTGRWATVARVPAPPRWSSQRISLAAGSVGSSSDVRVSCAGRSPVLELDAASLRAS